MDNGNDTFACPEENGNVKNKKNTLTRYQNINTMKRYIATPSFYSVVFLWYGFFENATISFAKIAS